MREQMKFSFSIYNVDIKYYKREVPGPAPGRWLKQLASLLAIYLSHTQVHNRNGDQQDIDTVK